MIAGDSPVTGAVKQVVRNARTDSENWSTGVSTDKKDNGTEGDTWIPYWHRRRHRRGNTARTFMQAVRDRPDIEVKGETFAKLETITQHHLGVALPGTLT